MNKKWSATLYRYALGCSLRFQKYIADEPITNTNPAFLEGIKTHETIEQYLSTKKDDLLSSFPASVKRDLDLLLNYEGKLYTEVKLEDEEFEGYADIVIEQESRWIIIDIKNRYETTIDREDLFQLNLYLYLLQKKQYKPEALIGIFACHNNFNCLEMQQATHIEVDELKKYIKKHADNAKRNVEYGKINTSYCRYCQYLYSCNVTKGEIQSIEDIARQYIHLKALVENYEHQLKDYVSNNGHNIIVDGLDIGFHVRNKTNIDVGKLIQTLNKHNIPITSVFNPSSVKVKQLAKRIDDVANCVSIEQDYEFSVKKVKNKGGDTHEE